MPIAPLLAAILVLQTADTPPQPAPAEERCGWLVATDDGLRDQPDPMLKPGDPAPLPAPPGGTKAAYCERESISTRAGDQRLLQGGLPLVIRAGGHEGVMELPPTAVFDYHRDGEQYAPGRPPAPVPPAKTPARKPATKKR